MFRGTRRTEKYSRYLKTKDRKNYSYSKPSIAEESAKSIVLNNVLPNFCFFHCPGIQDFVNNSMKGKQKSKKVVSIQELLIMLHSCLLISSY